MSGQVHHLRQALASDRPWEALTARYPTLDEVADALAGRADRAAVCEQIVSMYRRYCGEWGAFAGSTVGLREGAPDGTSVYAAEAARSSLIQVAADRTQPRGLMTGPRSVRRTPDFWQTADLGGADER